MIDFQTLCSRYEYVRILVANKLNIIWRKILTHNLSSVMARRVMPLPVDNRHTGLFAESAGWCKAIWLWSLRATCLPLVDTADKLAVDRSVGGQHLDKSAGPEPTIDI